MNRNMPTILVVDDDLQVRQWMREVLEEKGYKVFEAGNGNEALVRYALHQPDLVVMDIYMPGMEGLETILQLQKHSLIVKVLVVSGESTERLEQCAKTKALAAKHFLPKPFSAEALVDRVSALLMS
jgi:two-component system nitrogen regulation response regulator NtrX